MIAGILEAQGYKIHVSPEGPDGGVDILTGTDPLGFDEPKLAVQVKSENNSVDVKILRELKGVYFWGIEWFSCFLGWFHHQTGRLFERFKNLNAGV